MDLALWEPASILKERFLVTSSGKQEEVIRSFREIEIMEMLYGLHQGGGVSIHYVILSRQWVCDVNIIPKYIKKLRAGEVMVLLKITCLLAFQPSNLKLVAFPVHQENHKWV